MGVIHTLTLKSFFESNNININIIKELKNGFIIISDNNEITIYNNKYNKVDDFTIEEKVYNIFEVNKNKKETLSFIVNYENNKFNKYEYLIKDKNKLARCPKFLKEYPSSYSLFYLETENLSIFCGKNGIITSSDFLSKTVNTNLKESPDFKDKEPIYGGIQIDNNHAVLISKNPENQKESKLKLFLLNIKDKDKVPLKEIEDYSLNNGSLSFLKINNKKNDILVLCAAKKDKKNGFLYFFLDKKKPFFREMDFKVNCFCQLSKYEKNEKTGVIDIDENKKYKIEKTNYFLVGGEIIKDKSEERGIIKLLEYDKNTQKMLYRKEIKYDFNGPISCIIQSRKNGNILIHIKDGNLYKCKKKYIKEILKEK